MYKVIALVSALMLSVVYSYTMDNIILSCTAAFMTGFLFMIIGCLADED